MLSEYEFFLDRQTCNVLILYVASVQARLVRERSGCVLLLAITVSPCASPVRYVEMLVLFLRDLPLSSDLKVYDLSFIADTAAASEGRELILRAILEAWVVCHDGLIPFDLVIILKVEVLFSNTSQ